MSADSFLNLLCMRIFYHATGNNMKKKTDREEKV